MQIVYRLSPERPGGKPRPDWFSKQLCWENFAAEFGSLREMDGLRLSSRARRSNICHLLRHNLPDEMAGTAHRAIVSRGMTCFLRLVEAEHSGEAFLRALGYASRLPSTSED